MFSISQLLILRLKIHLVMGLIALAACVWVGTGLAYQESEDFVGGHLIGTVTWKGKKAKPRRYNLALYSDPYYCGQISDGKGWRISPFLKTRSNQSVQGVIIYIENIEKGKTFYSQNRIVLTKNCRFSPYISIVKRGELLKFENRDPVQHKLEIYQSSAKGAKLIFHQDLPRHPKTRKSDFLAEGNMGTHLAGPEVVYEVLNSSPLVFRCSYHEFMEGWTLVLTHPYFAISGDNGEFSIQDIPPGTYKLIAWHPLGHIEKTIEIAEKGTHPLNIEFEATSTTTYPLQPPKQNPFGIELSGNPNIVPTVELQEFHE